MKKTRAILFALIFIAVIIFLISQPRSQESQPLGLGGISFIIAIFLWAVWKVQELLKKRRKN